MTPIRHLTAVAGAAMAALLAGTALPGAAAATTEPPAPTSDADGDASTDLPITVLDAGDPATALVLSLDWRGTSPVGTVLRNVEQAGLSGAVAVAGQTINVAVDSELVDTREIVSSGADGTTVRVVVESFTQDADDEISASMAPDEPGAAILGLPVLVSFDAAGTRLGAEFEDLAAPDAEQLLGADDLLSSENVVFPAEPLGVGARWTGPFGGSIGDSPLLAEFELVEVTDTSFTVQVHVADIATAFIEDTGQEDTTAGADSAIDATLTASLPGLPVNYAMSAEALLQFTTTDGDLSYEFDLRMAQASTLTTV